MWQLIHFYQDLESSVTFSSVTPEIDQNQSTRQWTWDQSQSQSTDFSEPAEFEIDNSLQEEFYQPITSTPSQYKAQGELYVLFHKCFSCLHPACLLEKSIYKQLAA